MDGNGGDNRPGWARIKPDDNGCAADVLLEPAWQHAERRYQLLLTTIAERVWRFEIAPALAIGGDPGNLATAILRRARLVECNPPYAHVEQSPGCHCPGLWLSDVLLGSFTEQQALLTAFIAGNFRMVDVQTLEWDHEGRPVNVLTNMVGIIQDGRLAGLWGAQRALDRGAHLERSPRAWNREPSESVTITDADGRILFESPAMERALGVSDSARKGGDAFAGIHPEDVAALREVFQQTRANSGASASVARVRLMHQNGKYTQRAVVVHHLVDVPGPPLMALSVFDLPSEPRPAHMHVFGEPDGREDTLPAAIHQLNNLFTVITGHAQLALRRTHKDEPLAHDMQAVVDAVRRASGVVDGLEPRREGSRTAARTQDGTDGDGRRCRTA
jgi:hypothetical protein